MTKTAQHIHEFQLPEFLEVHLDEPMVFDTEENGEPEFSLSIHDVPGAPDATEIEEPVEDPEDSDVEIEEEGEPGEGNIWDWGAAGGHKGFLAWLKKMIENIPRHSGHDTTGLEKAIAYFESIDREISKAMRTDFKDEINSAHAEKAREEIENGLERLVERLEKVRTTKYKRHQKKTKKKAWYDVGTEDGFIKEAQKATKITGITITVPLIISLAARVVINGVVSAGHDLEELFDGQVKEWNFDKREKAELAQLLADMGYAMRRDRGFEVGKEVDQTRSDNRDWAASYYG
jgi:hypothetical protein